MYRLKVVAPITDNKITAIKGFRNSLGTKWDNQAQDHRKTGLKEAKEFIEGTREFRIRHHVDLMDAINSLVANDIHFQYLGRIEAIANEITEW